jgi:hypothetical protein
VPLEAVMSKTTAGKGLVVAAALAACGGPGADPEPAWGSPGETVVVIPTDPELHRLLLNADETWEGVGVRPGAIEVAPPGTDAAADGWRVMWSSVGDLSAMWGERGVAGAVYWPGRIVFIARDVPSDLPARVVVHELGHLLAPDRDDLLCNGPDGAMAGVMCDGIAAPLLTHADVDWICSSANEPCRSETSQ